jgi:hypothetical protein
MPAELRLLRRRAAEPSPSGRGCDAEPSDAGCPRRRAERRRLPETPSRATPVARDAEPSPPAAVDVDAEPGVGVARCLRRRVVDVGPEPSRPDAMHRCTYAPSPSGCVIALAPSPSPSVAVVGCRRVISTD